MSSYLIATIMLISGVWYCFRIYRGLAKPALSTWIMILSGTALSLITFLSASSFNFQSGFLNLSDALVQVSILVFSILFSKDSLNFRPFEKWYLIIGAGILAFWILSKDAFVSNLLAQCLMLLAYFPTLQKLITEKAKTEPYFSWFLAALASAISLISSQNTLSTIYALRSLIMCLSIPAIMFYYERKNVQV